jgi:hypothetical protein
MGPPITTREGCCWAGGGTPKPIGTPMRPADAAAAAAAAEVEEEEDDRGAITCGSVGLRLPALAPAAAKEDENSAFGGCSAPIWALLTAPVVLGPAAVGPAAVAAAAAVEAEEVEAGSWSSVEDGRGEKAEAGASAAEGESSRRRRVRIGAAKAGAVGSVEVAVSEGIAACSHHTGTV